jgi:hypothetical protein
LVARGDRNSTAEVDYLLWSRGRRRHQGCVTKRTFSRISPTRNLARSRNSARVDIACCDRGRVNQIGDRNANRGIDESTIADLSVGILPPTAPGTGCKDGTGVAHSGRDGNRASQTDHAHWGAARLVGAVPKLAIVVHAPTVPTAIVVHRTGEIVTGGNR